MAKGIRLLDKRAIFCLYRKKVIHVGAFESNIPINGIKQTIIMIVCPQTLYFFLSNEGKQILNSSKYITGLIGSLAVKIQPVRTVELGLKGN